MWIEGAGKVLLTGLPAGRRDKKISPERGFLQSKTLEEIPGEGYAFRDGGFRRRPSVGGMTHAVLPTRNVFLLEK